MGYGILRQHGDIVGSNHIRYAVMDFRVDVIGPPRQDDTPVSRLLHPFQRFLALAADILSHLRQLFPALMAGCPYFLFRNLGHDFYQLISENLFTGQRQERILEGDGGVS